MNLENNKRKVTQHIQRRLPQQLTNNCFQIINHERDDILKMVKEKDFQPRILYQAKISFKNEGKIKIFPGKQKQRLFVSNRIFF